MSDNLESNNIDKSVVPDTAVSAPVNPAPVTSEPVTPVNSVPDTNPGLTSFSSEEVAAPTPNTSVNPQENSLENVAQKEVVTRPLLWGIVVFLVFFALVIGAVSVYRYYQAQNSPVEDAVILPVTTPVDTQSSLDTTPVSTDTSAQADAISSEIQAIDTDIDGDVLSDSSLGL
jgi:hypothetical protein